MMAALHAALSLAFLRVLRVFARLTTAVLLPFLWPLVQDEKARRDCSRRATLPHSLICVRRYFYAKSRFLPRRGAAIFAIGVATLPNPSHRKGSDP
jgi:hypothetical protein